MTNQPDKWGKTFDSSPAAGQATTITLQLVAVVSGMNGEIMLTRRRPFHFDKKNIDKKETHIFFLQNLLLFFSIFRNCTTNYEFLCDSFSSGQTWPPQHSIECFWNSLFKDMLVEKEAAYVWLALFLHATSTFVWKYPDHLKTSTIIQPPTLPWTTAMSGKMRRRIRQYEFGWWPITMPWKHGRRLAVCPSIRLLMWFGLLPCWQISSVFISAFYFDLLNNLVWNSYNFCFIFSLFI